MDKLMKKIEKIGVKGKGGGKFTNVLREVSQNQAPNASMPLCNSRIPGMTKPMQLQFPAPLPSMKGSGPFIINGGSQQPMLMVPLPPKRNGGEGEEGMADLFAEPVVQEIIKKERKTRAVKLDEEGNVIKRPLSHYNRYVRQMIKNYTELPARQRMRAVADVWKTLTTEEKIGFGGEGEENMTELLTEAMVDPVVQEVIKKARKPRQRKVVMNELGEVMPPVKRQPTAYNNFMKAMIKNYAELPSRQRMGAVAREWKLLGAEEKAEWKYARTE